MHALTNLFKGTTPFLLLLALSFCDSAEELMEEMEEDPGIAASSALKVVGYKNRVPNIAGGEQMLLVTINEEREIVEVDSIPWQLGLDRPIRWAFTESYVTLFEYSITNQAGRLNVLDGSKNTFEIERVVLGAGNTAEKAIYLHNPIAPYINVYDLRTNTIDTTIQVGDYDILDMEINVSGNHVIIKKDPKTLTDPRVLQSINLDGYSSVEINKPTNFSAFTYEDKIYVHTHPNNFIEILNSKLQVEGRINVESELMPWGLHYAQYDAAKNWLLMESVVIVDGFFKLTAPYLLDLNNETKVIGSEFFADYIVDWGVTPESAFLDLTSEQIVFYYRKSIDGWLRYVNFNAEEVDDFMVDFHPEWMFPLGNF